MTTTTHREGLGMPSRLGRQPTLGTRVPTNINSSLWRRVGELGSASAFLMFLGEAGSDRLTISQGAFFMLAAAADARGAPSTRSELLRASGAEFRPSLRNSYRQLLKPSRMYPNALGWLEAKRNPDDDREQFLCLTAEGKAVVEGALLALAPLGGSS